MYISMGLDTKAFLSWNKPNEEKLEGWLNFLENHMNEE